jgi:predicted small metal-binding protein
MTKVLNCADVMQGCAMVIRGESDDDVMRQAGEHAARDHGVPNPPAEVVSQIRAAIHDEEPATSGG